MLKFFKHVKNRHVMDLVTENKLARRAAILETARQMIAEQGYESITVRDLASACRVSVPTLYNQFGGKDQLLAAAIEDHFLGDSYQLEIRRSLSGIDRIFAVLNHITDQYLESPAFHRRMMEAFASLESTTQVQQKISISLAMELERELKVMQRQDDLEAWIDTTQLASQLTAAFISATVIWSSGAIEEVMLPASVRYAVGLVLLGVTGGDVRDGIEQQVKQAQKDIQANPITAATLSAASVN